nr:hypothetical protein [Tanacetum cinerariifolium]
MAGATEAFIAAVTAALPLLPPPSPLTPLSSLLLQIPSPPLPLPSPPLPLPAPSSPLLLPATDRREDVPKADILPQKRLCLTAPTPREVGYRIVNVWDDMVEDMEDTTSTTLEAVNQRVIDLATILAQDTHEIYVWLVLRMGHIYRGPCQDTRDMGYDIDGSDFVTSDSVDYSSWMYLDTGGYGANTH